MNTKKYRFFINYVVLTVNNTSTIVKENIRYEDDLTEVIFNSLNYLLCDHDIEVLDIYITDRSSNTSFGTWYNDASITLMRDNNDIKDFLGKEELLIEYTDYLHNELTKRANSEEDYYYV